jgi:5-methylcytosine-specific restriction endonuclease McrBC regulatory subunit McrC
MNIRVTERGETDIDRATWRDLSVDASFWRLVERKIIKVSHQGGGVRLEAEGYVGRAIIGGHTIDIVEKVPGAVAALFAYATRKEFKIQKTASEVSELGPLAALVIEQYIQELNRYVSGGREAQYRRQASVGSLVGGKLNLTRTLHLRARGLRHLLAFERNVLRRDTLKNRVLLAATHEIETLASLLQVPSKLVSKARGFSMIFEDCRDSEVLFGERRLFREAAETLAEAGGPDRDLLALASILLAHQSFDPTTKPLGKLPRSWFLSLEVLFESAVRTILSDIVGKNVKKGDAHSRYVFPANTAHYNADPDLVISMGDRFDVVGDVKFKVWEGHASQADVYQLLVHAACFGVQFAFLVFPGDEYSRVDLGKSATGATTKVFITNILALRDDLRRAAEDIGIAAKRPAAA